MTTLLTPCQYNPNQFCIPPQYRHTLKPWHKKNGSFSGAGICLAKSHDFYLSYLVESAGAVVGKLGTWLGSMALSICL